MAELKINHISKSYNSENARESTIEVFNDFSFGIKDGEFITFFGPNGCGKSTLLNIISGVVKPDKGEVVINNRNVADANIGYVFQNYQDSLLPWRTNIKNITLPLELKGMNKSHCTEKAKRLLDFMHLDIPISGYPYQLSGGYQQLVALARALIGEPDLLVMDEPFNQLDFENRTLLNDKILEIWRKARVTILFVSHEIDEAILLGTKVVVLSKRPCQILNIFDVNLPEDRNHKAIETTQFFEIKRQVLASFEKAIQ